MIILPAIDIINGQPVRLYQGDYDQKEVVADSVIALAKSFVKQKATFIHIVDLDGAKAGHAINHELICQVAQTIPVPIEVGGGIRNMETVAYYLNHGIERIILGTSAIEDEAFLKAALHTYGSHIAVGLDCKDGFVSTHGWLNNSQIPYIEFAQYLEALGVSTIIFTDIAKDGTLSGPNWEMLQALKQAVSCNIIASGGIKDLSHIRQLVELDIYGAISGKAIVANTLHLTAAIEIAQNDH